MTAYPVFNVLGRSRGDRAPRPPYRLNRSSLLADGLWGAYSMFGEYGIHSLEGTPHQGVLSHVESGVDVTAFAAAAEFNALTGEHDGDAQGDAIWGIDAPARMDLIRGATEITVGGWLRVDTENDDHRCLTFGGTAGQNPGAVLLYMDEGGGAGWQLFVQDEVGANDRAPSGQGADAPGVAGRWDHIVGTFRGGSFVRIYQNGVRKAENTSTIIANLSTDTDDFDHFSVGGWRQALITSLNGGTFDMRVYNKALSDAEVAYWYNPRTRFDIYLEYGLHFYSFPVVVSAGIVPWFFREKIMQHRRAA